MAAQITRNLGRSLRSRLYSTQAVASESSADSISVSKVGGITVVSTDNNSPLSQVVFAVRAGSRFENVSNLGVSHLLRHASQMSTETILASRLIQDLQGFGGSLTYSTSRENAFITLTCLRPHLSEAMSLVAPTVSRNVFNAKEFSDLGKCSDKLEYDLAMLEHLPNVKAVELLHEAAFGTGTTLGNSLYTPENCVGTQSLATLTKFVKSHYKADRVGVAASGVDHADLEGMIRMMEIQEDKSAQPHEDKATYKGGSRTHVQPLSPYTYAAVAYQGPSYGSEQQLPAAVLQQILGTGPNIKYMNNSSSTKLGKAVADLSSKTAFSVSGYNATYSDTGLFGYVLAAPVGQAKQVMDVAKDALKSLVSSELSDAEIAAGKNMLKASLAMAAETGEANLSTLAEQAALDSKSIKSVEDIMKAVDSVDASHVKTVQKALLSSEPSSAVVGNLNY